MFACISKLPLGLREYVLILDVLEVSKDLFSNIGNIINIQDNDSCPDLVLNLSKRVLVLRHTMVIKARSLLGKSLRFLRACRDSVNAGYVIKLRAKVLF